MFKVQSYHNENIIPLLLDGDTTHQTTTLGTQNANKINTITSLICFCFDYFIPSIEAY
jgi:hypothetical protein